MSNAKSFLLIYFDKADGRKQALLLSNKVMMIIASPMQHRATINLT
jgi:hypothetical protein